jgi:hypothetical protein
MQYAVLFSLLTATVTFTFTQIKTKSLRLSMFTSFSVLGTAVVAILNIFAVNNIFNVDLYRFTEVIVLFNVLLITAYLYSSKIEQLQSAFSQQTIGMREYLKKTRNNQRDLYMQQVIRFILLFVGVMYISANNFRFVAGTLMTSILSATVFTNLLAIVFVYGKRINRNRRSNWKRKK